MNGQEMWDHCEQRAESLIEAMTMLAIGKAMRCNLFIYIDSGDCEPGVFPVQYAYKKGWLTPRNYHKTRVKRYDKAMRKLMAEVRKKERAHRDKECMDTPGCMEKRKAMKEKIADKKQMERDAVLKEYYSELNSRCTCSLGHAPCIYCTETAECDKCGTRFWFEEEEYKCPECGWELERK